MTRSPDHRPDLAATAAALTAQAVALERRVVELRRELADVAGRMTAIAEALGGLRAAGLLPEQDARDDR
ncbi:hypothetical protein PV703_04420 [Streptomyces sp. ME01-24h]|nr:hypothetical protein [Streptomyces sp. ME19-03-3]MDX3352581.1 hypothetical protein [Streptomyces sp. ME01-24h]